MNRENEAILIIQTVSEETPHFWGTKTSHEFSFLPKDLVDLLLSVKPVLTRILPSPVLVIEWTNLDLNGSVSSF